MMTDTPSLEDRRRILQEAMTVLYRDVHHIYPHPDSAKVIDASSLILIELARFLEERLAQKETE